MKNKFLIFLVTTFMSSFSFAKPQNTEKFQKQIKKHLDKIQKCHDEVSSKPATSGKVVVDFEIDDKASIHRIKINDEQTTLNNLNLQKCVVDKMKEIKFPKAAKSEIVSFSFPVFFK